MSFITDHPFISIAIFLACQLPAGILVGRLLRNRRGE